MAQKELDCPACGTTVVYNDGSFNAAHARCAALNTVSGRQCPDCGADTLWKISRYGVFHGCSNYPACQGRIQGARGTSARSKTAESKTTETRSQWDLEAYTKGGCAVCGGSDRGDTFFAHMACFDSLSTYESELLIRSCEDHRKRAETASTEPPPPPPAATPPTTPPVTSAQASSAGSALWALVAAEAGNAMAAMINAQVSKATADVKPTVASFDFKLNGEPLGKFEGTAHAALPKLMRKISIGFSNVLIVGPAGTGKTTAAAQVAKTLALPFGHLSCSGGMSESALLGRAIPNLSTGETRFETTRFLEIYEGGGVFLLDEVDNMDANVLVVLNSALANGHLSVPSRTANPVATRHAQAYIICAANTFGLGADRLYVGRNQLDAATLDRFVGATIEMDYDRNLEEALVSKVTGAAQLCQKVWAVREAIVKNKLRRVFGTRALLAAAREVSAGSSVNDAVKECVVGWTPAEVSAVWGLS